MFVWIYSFLFFYLLCVIKLLSWSFIHLINNGALEVERHDPVFICTRCRARSCACTLPHTCECMHTLAQLTAQQSLTAASLGGSTHLGLLQERSEAPAECKQEHRRTHTHRDNTRVCNASSSSHPPTRRHISTQRPYVLLRVKNGRLRIGLKRRSETEPLMGST